jgi:GMP synthase-like glutamine amidotransferase
MFVYDGYRIEKVNAQNDPLPTSPLGYDTIVILGGPMSVYDDLPYLKKEQELIRNAMKNDIPVLGICLGSQLIAQAAGGHVYKGKKKEIGWYNVYLTPASSGTAIHMIYQQTLRSLHIPIYTRRPLGSDLQLASNSTLKWMNPSYKHG